jgi:hypothetical protein
MCLRRAPEKYITGAALDRAALTEMSARNFPGGRMARKADKLTAICEPIALKMLGPRRLTTLWASTTCHRDCLASTNYKIPRYVIFYIRLFVLLSWSRHLNTPFAVIRVVNLKSAKKKDLQVSVHSEVAAETPWAIELRLSRTDSEWTYWRPGTRLQLGRIVTAVRRIFVLIQSKECDRTG